MRGELPFCEGSSSSSLLLSLLTSGLRLNTIQLIPVLAYFLKPIKDGYPGLVILTRLIFRNLDKSYIAINIITLVSILLLFFFFKKKQTKKSQV